MRVRLKVLVLDTASGRWETFASAPGEGSSLSASLNRESADVRQVDELKAQAYRGAVAELLARF